MSDKKARKPVKIGVVLGGGPPPGYRWTIEIEDKAYDEAREFLDDEQYDHIRRQFCELATQEDPTHSETIDVRPIENFFELRDKWGVLKRLNVRVFFFVDKGRRVVYIPAAVNKKNDGPTPLGDKVRARNRIRKYLEGTQRSS